jgi:hypothetical protein
MNRVQRTPPLVVLTFAVVGVGVGLLVQFVRSAQGDAPLVPPLSLSFSMLVLGGVLVALGIALRRAVTRKSGKPVNPLGAVRLLAGAKAGQFVGALLGGFGGGLVLQVLTRSILPPATSWVPMVLVLVSGAALTVCGYIAESLCRVPPSDPDDGTAPGQAGPELGAA